MLLTVLKLPAPGARPNEIRIPRGLKLAASGVAAVGAVCALLAAVLLELHQQGAIALAWETRRVEQILPETGKAYVADLGTEWASGHAGPSRGQLLEDGIPLGPGDAVHQDVRDLGEGRYSFWHKALYFSTSDNSDPRVNDRTYDVRWPLPVSRECHQRVRIAAAMGLLLLGVLLGALPRRGASTPSTWLQGRGRFWLTVGVFAVVLTGQAANFATRFRDPALAKTGLSILGVAYSDALGWHVMGESIAEGQGMHTAWPAHRPFYGIFLALFYTWTGGSQLLAVGLNVVLIAVSAALIFRIGEMLAGTLVGLLAAVGFSLSKCTLDYSLTINTEVLGLTLGLACTLELLRGVKSGEVSHLTWAGVWLGLSNLTRPLTLTAAPLYFASVLLLLWPRGRRTALTGALLLSAAATLTIAPWLIRQQVKFGILSISQNTVEVLYAATTPKYGSWVSAVSREPGLGHLVNGDRYRAYSAATKENLRQHWRFYLHNVADSFTGCFRLVGDAARPLLPLLGFLLVLGCAISREEGSACRRAVLAVLLVALWVGFSKLSEHQGAAVDLAAIALLPFTTRRSLGLIHSAGLIGTIFGVAMFGMKDPDRRLYLMLEWGFLLANLCLLAGGCRLLERMVSPADAAAAAEDDAHEAPRWFRWLSRIAIALVIVSGARVAWLTIATDIEPPIPRLLSVDEAKEVLLEFANRNPGLLGADDISAPILLNPDVLNVPPDARFAVFRCRLGLGGSLFHLPAPARVPHWARFFQTRHYDRTVCHYQLEGVPYPRGCLRGRPVVIPGELPEELRERECLVISRVVFDPKYRPLAQEYLLEGIAIIPIQDGRFEFEAAHITSHPLHPGTPRRIEKQ